MTRATKIELDLYRSGLLAPNRGGPFQPKRLAASCKVIARHVARIERHRLAACNGINRWDQKAQGFFASWTEEDQAKADRETEESRKAIVTELRDHLKRGFKVTWYEDPRAGSVLRVFDKHNLFDAFL